MRDPKQLLMKHKIYPSLAINGFICGACETEVAVRADLFSQHMRTKHKEKSWKEVLLAMEEVRNTFPQAHEQRELYRNPLSHRQILPALPGLGIMKARRCRESGCNQILETIPALREHLRKRHGKRGVPLRHLQSFPEIYAQTLRKRSMERQLFEVSTADNNIMNMNNETIMDNPNSAPLRRALEKYDASLKFGGSAYFESTDTREESNFVYLSKPRMRLELHGLDMKMAAGLAKGVQEIGSLGLDSKCGSLLLKGVRQCLQEAASIRDRVDLFETVFLDFCSPGGTKKSRKFSFLPCDERGRRTLNMYATRICSLILMALRVFCAGRSRYPRIKMKNDLRVAVSALLFRLREKCKEKEAGKKSVAPEISSVLREILLESGDMNAGPSDLFVSAYTACICVEGYDETNLRFRQGKEVSPHISAVIYAASCVAIRHHLDIRGQAESSRWYKETCKAFETGSASAIGVLCALRSICYVVRDIEYCTENYQECEIHRACGFVDGIEVSGRDVGVTVRKLHAEIRRNLWGEDKLLRGASIPFWILDGLNSLYDDMADAGRGRSFLNHPGNVKYLKSCRRWVFDTVLHLMGEKELKAWVELAHLTVDLILTMMHLVGGAPGRGTELGFLQIINTGTVKRSVFVSGPNCKIAPLYCKTRNMRGGVVCPLTRHLDVASSKLLKEFLVLIQPWVFIIQRDEKEVEKKKWQALVKEGNMCEEEMKHKCAVAEEDLKYTSCFLTMSKSKCNRTATIVGTTMQKYGLPLSFSKYRQWQRGLVKRLFSGSKELLSATLHEDRIEEFFDEEAAAEMTQGAHSVQTSLVSYGVGRGNLGTSDCGLERHIYNVYEQASFKWHEIIELKRAKRSLEDSWSPNAMKLCKTNKENSFRIDESGIVKGVLLKNINVGSSHGMETSKSHEKHKFICRNIYFADKETAAAAEAVSQKSAKSTEILPNQLCTTETVWNQKKYFIDSTTVEEGGHDFFNPTVALEKVTGKDGATFRSLEQLKAMEIIAANSSDIIVILRTGEGKTAVVTGPCTTEKKVTVWITMLRALKAQVLSTFSNIGLESVELENFDVTSKTSVKIVLASPEQVKEPRYESTIYSLYRRKLLQRIVVDEAHIPILSDDYRPSMSRLVHTRPQGIWVPIVLLTATAPPLLLKDIVSSVGCNLKGMQVIRGTSRRPNLSLNVVLLRKGIFNLMSANVGALLYSACKKGGNMKERHIVMCLTIEHATRLHEKWNRNFTEGTGEWDVECGLYHSKMRQELQMQSLQAWCKNEKCHFVMFATEGFGVGIDASNVRTVIVAGGSRSLIEFWQVTGRAGRDGDPAFIHVLYHSSFLLWAGAHEKERMRGPVHRAGDFRVWAECNTGRCRRVSIEKYLDGVNQPLACTDFGQDLRAQLCDICKGGNIRQGNEPECNEMRHHLTGRISCDGIPASKGISSGFFHDRPVSSKREAPELGKSMCTRQIMDGRLSSVKMSLKKLREICYKLRDICPACLFRSSIAGKGLKKSELKHDIVPRICLRGHCLRCMQTGHDAARCNVMPVPSSRRVCCRECFLLYIGGETVHIGDEFGRRGCPFRVFVQLVMLCWFCPSMGAKLLMHCKNHGFKGTTNSSFALWLCTDLCGKVPGIVYCLPWVTEILRLHLL